MELFISPRILRLIEMAVDEDEVDFDVSSRAFFGDRGRGKARITAKEDLVVSGQNLAGAVFRRIDEAVKYQPQAEDGEVVKKGEVIALVEGRHESLLKGERIALNFLQRMCGVATWTKRHVEALGEGKTRVVDTRKTLPGYRVLDKYAVRCGGGHNHRYNLSAGVMIKENHIAAAGGIARAIAKVKAQAAHTLRVEVEVESLEEVKEALAGGAEIIMLDNMSDEEMKEAIAVIRADRRGGEVIIEGSGNIDLERLKGFEGLDLDVVSLGALTHSAPAVDLSMLVERE